MAQAVIGALRVNLGMNSAQFSKGLKRANTGLQKFANAAKAGLAAASVAAVAAAATIRRVSEEADKFGKSAQSVGVATEELGRLAHAAEMSGASFETITKGLRKISQNAMDASRGLAASAEPFDELGVSIEDANGKLRESPDILKDVADKFENMPDGVTKTALALDIFGKAGADLIPMLNQGRSGIEAMGLEAENLGLVFSGQTFRYAEAFNDNLARMQKATAGVANTLVAGVLPALTQLSDRMVAGVFRSTALKDITTALSGAFNVLVKGIIFTFDHLGDLYDLFKLFVAAKIVTFVVATTGAFITMAKGIRLAGLAMALYSSIQRIGVASFVVIAGVIAKATGYYDDFAATLRGLYDEAKKFIPKEISDGAEKLANDMKNLALGTDGAAESFDTYIKSADGAAASFGNLSSISKSAGSLAKSSVDSASDAWNGLRSASNKATNSMISGMESFGNTAGGILSGLFNKTLTWQGALVKALSAFGQMQLNSYNPTTKSGGFLKGLVGSFFGGFRANGGSVLSGKSYMVGERGPEMFSPGVSGNITPNHDLSGGGGVAGFHVSVGVSVDDEGAIQAYVKSQTQQSSEQARQGAINEVKQNFGSYSNQQQRSGTVS
ncbi:phage tail tape measure protein [Lentilitoribacter sp. EG35]|uniref:phage tail tape measure protein n=1 Tax=Lentilitoribacter sp. EG35 TaxID=3234192 RepID=UPI003460070D